MIITSRAAQVSFDSYAKLAAIDTEEPEAR